MTEGVDVDKFLEENNLLDLKESFVEKQVSLEELADFTNSELTAFARDLQLDDVRTAAFIAAIRKIKGTKSTSTSAVGEPNVSSSASSRPKKSGVVSGNADLVHLIISPQEHEAITKLHERFDQTSTLVNQLEQSFDTLKKNGEVCQQDITVRMELVYKQVQEWKTKLYEAVDAMKNQKVERLQQQLDQLKTYRAEINQGKNKYQELIDDPSLDVQSRKKQVVEMVDKILVQSEIPLLMVTQPKVEFGWSDQYLNTLLSHIVINDCDQPFPPYVIVSVIRSSSVVLQVSVVAGESGREVLEFAVEYAVLPSDEANPNPKSKSGKAAIDDGSESLPRSGPSRLLVASSSQANVSPKAKGKSKKKKDDDSSSDESKSDKSSAEEEEEDEDEDSSKSSSEDESDESESDKDSDKSSDKSSGDSDDASDSSAAKKKKNKKKKSEKESERARPSSRRINPSQADVFSEKARARSKSNSASLSGGHAAEVSPPHDDATHENESDDEKLGHDEVEGPTAGQPDEAGKGDKAEEAKDKEKKGSQSELEVDPISLKYGHLDLYWENGGALELASKEGKRALLKPSEIDKSNEKAAAKIPPNALTYEFVLKGMKDDRSYLVRSRARNKSGWGEYSSPIEILTEKMEVDSKILKAGEKEILMGWLPKKYQERKLKLLFRASKKGFASTAFHAKCDNKGPTLTVIKAKSGNVFGGFTTVPWGMSNTYRFDKHSFIFLLRKKESKKKKKDKPSKKKKNNEPPVKWKVTNTANAVYHGSSYGPTFGGGFDFYLCSNCDTTGSSYANAGNSYACPRDQNLLAGTYNFLVAEYEVYEIKK